MNFVGVVFELVFGIAIFLVLARFILQSVRADFYNPISQMFIRITDPILRPLRRIIPGLFGLDMAAIVLLLLLQGAELIVTHLLRGLGMHNPILFLAEMLGSLIYHTALLFQICIFISIISSWISGAAQHHPLVQVANQISSPLLRPARRLLPPFNGIDFSPVLALIFVFAIMYLVAAPLIDLPHRPY